MKRISEVSRQLAQILLKKHLPFRARLNLLRAYIGVVIKRFFRNRLPSLLDYHHHKMLGFSVTFDEFEDFYWNFIGIFIDEEYYFSAANKTPFIIDCGGNIGIATLYFKWLYPRSRILVFEPVPDNVRSLKHNLAGLESVEVHESALGGRMGTMDIYGSGRSATTSKNFIAQKKQMSKDEREKKVTVRVETLSTYVKGPVDFLKLDIEGAEEAVLAELESANALKHVRQIGMEYHHCSFEENRLSTILAILEKERFDVFFTGVGTMPDWEYYSFMVYARRGT